MPRPPVTSSESGQRLAVAGFMAVLLAVSAALAYATVYQPALRVAAHGLTFTLPPDWVEDPPPSRGGVAASLRFLDSRRPSLSLTVERSGSVASSQPDAPEPSVILKQGLDRLFHRAVGPEQVRILSRRVGGLEVASWAGVSQFRVPYMKPLVWLHAIAVVADGEGGYWLLTMRDQKFSVESMQDRVRAHAALFDGVLDTVRAEGA